MATFGEYAADALYAAKPADGRKLTKAEVAEVLQSAYRKHQSAHRAPIHAIASENPDDPLFAALAQAEGAVIAQMTDSHKKTVAVKLVELCKAHEGLTPEEIGARAATYRRRFPGIAVTAAGLVKHWSTLGTPPRKSTPYTTLPSATEAPSNVADGSAFRELVSQPGWREHMESKEES